jgi:ferritin-like metal-binding protein YciE
MIILNLQHLFERDLEIVYDCEHRVVKEWSKVLEAVSSGVLRTALECDWELAKSNIERLNGIFATLDRLPVEEPDHSFRSISEESQKLIKNIDRSPLLDSALIIFGSQVHHHKIALYRSLGALARALKLSGVAGLLEQAASDENAADETLIQIGLTSVNPAAVEIHNRPHDWPIV